MAARGYCSVSDVGSYLHRTLDAGQSSLAAGMIESAESWIDNALGGMSWLNGGQQVVDVEYTRTTPLITLNPHPIVSVDEVKLRWAVAEEVLQSDVDYEIRDLRKGVLYIPFRWNWRRATDTVMPWPDKLTVTFTPNNDPPPYALRQAAYTLVAYWMVTAVGDGADPNVIKRYQVGSELTVEYWPRQHGIPAQVYALLWNTVPDVQKWAFV